MPYASQGLEKRSLVWSRRSTPRTKLATRRPSRTLGATHCCKRNTLDRCVNMEVNARHCSHSSYRRNRLHLASHASIQIAAISRLQYSTAEGSQTPKSVDIQPEINWLIRRRPTDCSFVLRFQRTKCVCSTGDLVEQAGGRTQDR